MKRALPFVLICTAMALFSGCGSDKNSSADGISPITMPADGDAGVVKREEIPVGVFKLVKIESSYATDTHGALYRFSLDMTTPGSVDSNDKITHQMETTQLEKSLATNESAWPYLKFNLPSEIVDGGFKRVNEFGVQWKSEKKSVRWWQNPGKGVDYLDLPGLFEKGAIEGRATYTAAAMAESKGILQMQGNSLHVYMRYKIGGELGGVAILHMTYQKQ